MPDRDDVRNYVRNWMSRGASSISRPLTWHTTAVTSHRNQDKEKQNRTHRPWNDQTSPPILGSSPQRALLRDHSLQQNRYTFSHVHCWQRVYHSVYCEHNLSHQGVQTGNHLYSSMYSCRQSSPTRHRNILQDESSSHPSGHKARSD